MVVIFDPSFLPGGFILACEDFWENVRPSTCRLRFLLVCFVLKRIIFYARISPQWLSELGRLWPNVS